MNGLFLKVRDFVKSLDIFTVLVCLGCSAISLIALYSFWKTGQVPSRVFVTQIVAVVLGVVLALMLSSIPYEMMAGIWRIYVPAIAFLMLLTYTHLGKAASVLSNERAWLDFGPVNLQPSELLKLAFILTFALHLTKIKENINHLRPFLLLCLHGAIPIVMVVLQHDFGMALIFLIIFVIMLFVAGLSIRWFVIGLAAAAVSAPVLWHFLPGYVRGRFYAAWHPENYLTGAGKGWQQYYGRQAFGAGGLFGRGIASDNLFNNVPEAHNDFIFSYIGQIMGFVGAALTLFLLTALCIKILLTARMSRDMLGTLICSGIFIMFLAQSVINIGMVLCASPVTGITLPFFSAGGTSVVVSYLAVGIVLSVYRQNKKDLMFD